MQNKKIETKQDLITELMKFDENFTAEEIEKVFQQKMEDWKIKFNILDEKELLFKTLRATYNYFYNIKMKPNIVRHKFYMIACSPAQMFYKKMIDDAKSLFVKNRQEALKKYNKFLFDSEGNLMWKPNDRNPKERLVEPYSASFVFGYIINSDNTVKQPAFLEVRDNNATTLSNKNAFSFLNISCSTFGTKTDSNNVYRARLVDIISIAEQVDKDYFWNNVKSFPEMFQTSFSDINSKIEKISNLSGNDKYDRINSFIALSCIIDSINKTTFNSYQFTISDIETIDMPITGYLPSSSNIDKRFGNQSEVILFGHLYKDKNNNTVMNGWSVLESFDKSKVLPVNETNTEETTDDMMHDKTNFDEADSVDPMAVI